MFRQLIMLEHFQNRSEFEIELGKICIMCRWVTASPFKLSPPYLSIPPLFGKIYTPPLEGSSFGHLLKNGPSWYITTKRASPNLLRTRATIKNSVLTIQKSFWMLPKTLQTKTSLNHLTCIILSNYSECFSE